MRLFALALLGTLLGLGAPWSCGPRPASRGLIVLSSGSDEQATPHQTNKRGPAFERIERGEGRLRLLQLASDVNGAEDLGAVLVMANTLLYSGMPEQALELYARCFDSLSSRNSSLVHLARSALGETVPIISDGRLLMVVYRALLNLGRVGLLASVFESASELGVAVDNSSLNILLAELAESSERGLRLALLILKSASSGGFAVNTNGYAGLLRGIRMHGLSRVPRNADLVAPLGHNSSADEEEAVFRLDLNSAERMAIEFVEAHWEQRKRSSVNAKVLTEALRVVFRTAEMRRKEVLDRNFETDTSASGFYKADAGLVECLALLKRFKEDWTIHVADCLLEECLRLGDVEGVRFVARQMRQRGVLARTSTLNLALQLYADDGNAEAALKLLNDAMKPSAFCQPNGESFHLVMSSCLKSQRGLFLAGPVASEMLHRGHMDKQNWDKFLEYSVVSRGPWLDVVRAMACAGFQPDDETVYLLLSALNDRGMVDQAIEVFEFQMDDTQLSPPSRRSVLSLLEILRNHGRSAVAVDVLERVVAVFLEERELTIGESFLRAAARPDVRAFAIAMEACLAKEDSETAFRVFQLMEKVEISPSRRIYSALIRAFGLRGDIYSSIGVFNEMIRKFTFPDTYSLNALLSVAKVNPPDLRLCVPILENLIAQGVDLDIFSHDVIMRTFDDGKQLGPILQLMLEQGVPSDCTRVEASLSVLACLAQAVRVGDSVAALTKALLFIGRSGIVPDSNTIEYFTIPRMPTRNSPGSRNLYKSFLPNHSKLRSALNIDVPCEWITDVNAPKNVVSEFVSLPADKGNPQYFETGEDNWRKHVSAILAAMSNTLDSGIDEVNREMVAEDMVRILEKDLTIATFDAEEKTSVDANDFKGRTSKKSKLKKHGARSINSATAAK